MYQQLSGPDYIAAPAAPRMSGAPRFSILILFWILAAVAGGAYWFLRHREFAPGPPADNRGVSAAAQFPTDIEKHVARATSSANLAETGVRQSEEQLRRALSLADNPAEVRHLHAAIAALETAHEQLLTDCDELDSVNSLMKGTYQ